jgi:glucokinase
MNEDYATLESVASGWAIEKRARHLATLHENWDSLLLRLADGQVEKITTRLIGQAASQSDEFAKSLLVLPAIYLADAISQVIALLCPRRIVVGGGVSLMPDVLWLGLIRELVKKRVFKPFAGRTDIVPAALGEEVVVHGAIALARKKLA